MADDKKIIIDEDWKSQVQAEKEAAVKAEPGEATSGGSPSSPSAKADSSEVVDPPMPPASFEMLLTTLATEALVALGQVPHPITGETHVHRNQAKFLIDTVDILKQKTTGNLSTSEQEVLDSLLHQLRMVFVQTADAAASSAPK